MDFDSPAFQHRFLLRCFPQDNNRQRIIFLRCYVYPDPVLNYCSDWAGNRIATGFINHKHESFSVQIKGEAETNLDIFESYEDNSISSVFRYPTPLTFAGEKLIQFHRTLELAQLQEPYEKALMIMRAVADEMSYESGITNAGTTAEVAFSGKKGVCQDYTHIMLALCHLEKLPARYVVGLMAGEGESHAWVEVLCRGIWYGFDPANNLLVTDGYIKLSHGRDYTDCQINRGSFKGIFQQKQTVLATVTLHNANQ